MTIRTAPHLGFSGEAREAMSFYREVFGGELTLSTYGEFGMSENPDDSGLIMHSQLLLPGGFALMGSDAPPGMPRDEGARVSVAYTGEASDVAQLATAFSRLVDEGGTLGVPFVQAPWGDTFGMCTDRFGIARMFDAAGDAASPDTPGGDAGAAPAGRTGTGPAPSD